MMNNHGSMDEWKDCDPLFSFAPIFGDHMVLQRGTSIPVWGTGPEGAAVTVSCRNQLVTGFVASGRWSVVMAPMETGPAFSLEAGILDLQGSFVGCRKLENLVVGDVYLAGGQSNMEFRLGESIGAAKWISEADFPLIRSWFAPRIPYAGAEMEEPEADFTKPPTWQICTPDTASDFSAAAFHFARRLMEETGTPIGILDANWGGSSASCWMNETDLENDALLEPWLADYRNLLETLDAETYENARRTYACQVAEYEIRDAEAKRKGLSLPERDIFVGGYPWPPPNGPKNALSPCGLYHTILEPMAPFALKGVIWYQGETDANDPGSPMGADKYGRLFSTMISRWRVLFHQPELPFFFVQLTSYGCDGNPDGENWPILREQQKHVAEIVPGCAMAVIHDYGDRIDIHPKHKQPVGERLALLALKRIYDKPVTDSGPVLQSAVMEGDSVILRFSVCATDPADGSRDLQALGELIAGSRDPLSMSGLFAEEGNAVVLNGFSLADADGVHHPASAQIEGNAVRVRADGVHQPCFLRYGWKNHTMANLFNQAGLPASPFRLEFPG